MPSLAVKANLHNDISIAHGLKSDLSLAVRVELGDCHLPNAATCC